MKTPAPPPGYTLVGIGTWKDTVVARNCKTGQLLALIGELWEPAAIVSGYDPGVGVITVLCPAVTNLRRYGRRKPYLHAHRHGASDGQPVQHRAAHCRHRDPLLTYALLDVAELMARAEPAPPNRNTPQNGE